MLKTQDTQDIYDPPPKNYISSGSTLLNLALTNEYDKGYGLGKIVNLIGDSSTGKTLIALTCLAAQALKSNDIRLVYDDVEAALEFNLPNMFSTDIAKRIDTSIVSDTMEQFFSNVLNLIDGDRPFIYILDSFDALTCNEEVKRAIVLKEKMIVEGSFNAEKQKMVSSMLRSVKQKLKDKDSLVIIVSQTRDNIGFGSMFNTKYRAGGRAIKFYSTHEIWLSMRKTEKKLDRVIGHVVEANITKNKVTGKERKVQFPIYYDYGLDDISSCVDFLMTEKYWEKRKNTILATDLEIEGTAQSLIAKIEEKGLEEELKKCAQKKWNEIEDKLKLNRKNRWERKDEKN